MWWIDLEELGEGDGSGEGVPEERSLRDAKRAFD